MNYFARALNKSETNLDMGRFGRMGVFYRVDDKDELLGSYIRNYGTNFNAFFPFRMNGKDLALYSPDYTATRIMELPSCKDLGGEEPDDGGFCPTDYFIPTFIDQEMIMSSTNDAFPDTRTEIVRINNPDIAVLKEFTRKHQYPNLNTGQECEDIITYRPLTQLSYYPFGFVAGCVWGDDSTDKVQYLDLSEADKGMLVREERFGYIELTENLSLKESIDMSDYGYDPDDEAANYIRIKLIQTFDLRTGRVI